MKKSKAPKLEIGDTVYKYLSFKGVAPYTVIGKREYPDNIQYEVECQACSHGFKCQALITLDDNGQYKYVAMINDDEDSPQYYWHNEGIYYLTSAAAKMAEVEKWIATGKKELKKLEEQVENKKKKVSELEVYALEIKGELQPFMEKGGAE